MKAPCRLRRRCRGVRSTALSRRQSQGQLRRAKARGQERGMGGGGDGSHRGTMFNIMLAGIPPCAAVRGALPWPLPLRKVQREAICCGG